MSRVGYSHATRRQTLTRNDSLGSFLRFDRRHRSTEDRDLNRWQLGNHPEETLPRCRVTSVGGGDAFVSQHIFFNVALRPQRSYGLLGTGNPGRPHTASELQKVNMHVGHCLILTPREINFCLTEACRPVGWEKWERRVKPRNRRQRGRPVRLPWTAARATNC